MEEVTWLTDDEQRAWRALQSMTLRLNGELARELADDSGLSLQDYGVLVALTDRPDGRARLFEIARELGWETSRLSHHVSRMQARGLVKKERCAVDRRGFEVTLTARGRRKISDAAPGHVAAVRRLFVERLSPAQLEALAEVAETVLAGLDTEESPGRSPRSTRRR